MTLSPDTRQRIDQLLSENRIVLFMKGTRNAPRCGFSARVLKVLGETGIPFKTADMDSDQTLWQTLSEMNNWPTSPQIYVNGEFIGGCDILMEMNRNGELKQMLEAP